MSQEINQPIKTSNLIHDSSNKLSGFYNEIMALQIKLGAVNVSLQSVQSDDMVVFKEKIENAQIAISNLGSWVEEYSSFLSVVDDNYRTAQENSIYKAMLIPK